MLFEQLDGLFKLLLSIDSIAICFLITIIVMMLDILIQIKWVKIYYSLVYKKFRKTLFAIVVSLLLVLPLNYLCGWPWENLDLSSLIIVSIMCGAISKYVYELFLSSILKEMSAIIYSRFTGNKEKENGG